jgi:hypothetical protein
MEKSKDIITRNIKQIVTIVLTIIITVCVSGFIIFYYQESRINKKVTEAIGKITDEEVLKATMVVQRDNYSLKAENQLFKNQIDEQKNYLANIKLNAIRHKDSIDNIEDHTDGYFRELSFLRDKNYYILKEALVWSKKDPLYFYLEKLKDPDFVSTYGDDGRIWHIAAEELGALGKPAIPFLIKKLSTKDPYELNQVFYALHLAYQRENVKEFTNSEMLPEYSYGFPVPATKHKIVIKSWTDWFNKYKSNWP